MTYTVKPRRIVHEHLLLDRVRNHFGLVNDKQLAEMLGYSQVGLSHFRTGIAEITDNLRLTIHELTDWPFTYIRGLEKLQEEIDHGNIQQTMSHPGP